MIKVSSFVFRFLQAGGRQEILPGCFGLVNKRFKTPMFSLLYVVPTLSPFTFDVSNTCGLTTKLGI